MTNSPYWLHYPAPLKCTKHSTAPLSSPHNLSAQQGHQADLCLVPLSAVLAVGGTSTAVPQPKPRCYRLVKRPRKERDLDRSASTLCTASACFAAGGHTGTAQHSAMKLAATAPQTPASSRPSPACHAARKLPQNALPQPVGQRAVCVEHGSQVRGSHSSDLHMLCHAIPYYIPVRVFTVPSG